MKIIFVRNRNKILDFSNKPHSPKGNDQSCVTVICLIVVGFLNTKTILIFVLHCVFSDVFLFSKMWYSFDYLGKGYIKDACSERGGGGGRVMGTSWCYWSNIQLFYYFRNHDPQRHAQTEAILIHFFIGMCVGGCLNMGIVLLK